MFWHPTERESRPRVPGKGTPRGALHKLLENLAAPLLWVVAVWVLGGEGR
jgi:hypothetical protein